MTTRAQLVSKVNRLIDDTPTTRSITGTGNGSRTVFELKSKPVVPESETITVGGVGKTRDTDYTIDNENGVITFTTAPANAATITGSFQYSYYSTQAKIDAINDAVNGGFLQKEVIDDWSCIPNGKVLSDFESDETWSVGTADTFKFKTGTQGLRLAASTNSRTVTLDMRGRSTDKIRLYVYADDSSLATSAILRFQTTNGTDYYSYTFTTDIQDGWNYLDISRSDFSSTGSPDWRSIVRIDLVYTGTAHVTVDQLSLINSDIQNSIDLPSGTWNVLSVKLYASDGEHFTTIRTWRFQKGSGQSGVNQLQFENQLLGRKLEIRYAKVYNYLDTDAEVTDIPSEAEKAVALKAAADVVLTKEARRLRSGDTLGYKGEESSAREMSHVQLSERLEQKAIRERARANLAPTFVGTTTIQNN